MISEVARRLRENVQKVIVGMVLELWFIHIKHMLENLRTDE